jgi:hypothetical protein
MSAWSGEPRTVENLELVSELSAAFFGGDLDKAFARMDTRVEPVKLVLAVSAA